MCPDLRQRGHHDPISAGRDGPASAPSGRGEVPWLRRAEGAAVGVRMGSRVRPWPGAWEERRLGLWTTGTLSTGTLRSCPGKRLLARRPSVSPGRRCPFPASTAPALDGQGHKSDPPRSPAHQQFRLCSGAGDGAARGPCPAAGHRGGGRRGSARPRRQLRPGTRHAGFRGRPSSLRRSEPLREEDMSPVGHAL